ncbi:MAG: hypothetical protein MRY78_00300 [Saprospiraceae bacterium]|nr:hypothetical protein [Saprospiraceae bacterium]
MKKLLLLLLLCSSCIVFAQRTDNPFSQQLKWRNIGPANMMGRIAAVDALHTDYRHVLCASASGGVFKSTNGGITWDAIFDRYGAGSIGAVTLCQQNPDIIWVGTGEAANRNSSGWGDGIYKSIDGGKTFQHMGLEDTHHIAEIAIHPKNPDIVFVAAVGHLWGYKGSRGLYMTTDGGQNWKKLTSGLPDDSKTGCTEVIFHPDNPDILFAGFYHRLREPYFYTSGGEQGGMFKSIDGGKSWQKLTKGLPQGATGMIDISIHLNNPDIMVAAVEADENLPKGVPGSGVYRSDNGGESWTFKYFHAVRPFYHGQIEIDPINPDNIYIVSRGFEISRDGGETFESRRWRTDGGDDHDMWIAPYDSNIMYLCTDQGLRLSIDGGKSILSFNNMAIGQYYAIGVDMRDPYYVIGGLQDNGLWVGPSNSREVRGILNEHNSWVGEGDGFHAQIDPTDWRTAYIVNHVGFAAKVNLETREHEYITPTPETIVNFKAYFDPRFPDTMIRYTIYPGEHWFYYEYVDRPKLPAQFRFNWSSPLVLSPNNPHTIYFGGNHVFKSVDQGKSWRIISPDLTANDPKWRNPTNSGYLTNSVTGGENHYTIITIAESPMDEAVVWAGTDDGKLHLTRNGGTSWQEVGLNLPKGVQNIWVSRVMPSAHVPGRCYVTLDNHRKDDMQAYVFVTEDFGQSWSNITSNLPKGWSTYVIREDFVNPDLLFVGTEEAVHFSYNRGQKWHELMANMPTVAIHDLVIHPREGDLVAGTHGRSIWIMDNIEPLRQLNDAVTKQALHLFQPKKATRWQRINTGRKQPYFEFRGQNPVNAAAIDFWVGNEKMDSVDIIVKNPFSEDHWEKRVAVQQGINRVYWNFRMAYTLAEIKAYHNELTIMLKALEQRIPDDLEKEKKVCHQLQSDLAEIAMDTENFKTIRALNDIRRKAVEQFAGYALGEPFFGKKRMGKAAQAGTYEVQIKAGNNIQKTLLEFRDDPLLTK